MLLFEGLLLRASSTFSLADVRDEGTWHFRPFAIKPVQEFVTLVKPVATNGGVCLAFQLLRVNVTINSTISK